ncbi:MAG: murein L,D-transpeptidase family protein [Hyphomicrobium sp.]
MRFLSGALARTTLWARPLIGAMLLAASSAGLATAAEAGDAAAVKPLFAETLTFLQTKKIEAQAPVYIRIFKEESELEVWKERPGGRFVLIKTYPICNWSGALGPKQAIGDLMAPEGFYSLAPGGLKPDSKYHLALNIGYPNALDKALGRTGDFIMVHGDCKSVGCFAMTDGLIEEIYAFVREAFAGGQERVPVHAFPFRMTDTNLARHADNAAAASWAPLKEAYDDFGKSRMTPRVAMCGKRYVVNPVFTAEAATPESAAAACPASPGKLIAPVSRKLAKKLVSQPLIAIGVKLRTPESISTWSGSAARAAAADAAKRAAKAKEAGRQADIGGVTPFLHP